MYESKFGLKHTPFQRDIPLDTLFRAQAHQELGRRLIYVAEQRRVLLLTGEIGTGKSTALRVLKGQLDTTRYVAIV
jgi:general secretion pathway protein A